MLGDKVCCSHGSDRAHEDRQVSSGLFLVGALQVVSLGGIIYSVATPICANFFWFSRDSLRLP